jgi:single-stranded DNA-binding protein
LADSKILAHISGNVGTDPQTYETKVGPVTKFSVAVTLKYGQGDEGLTRWVQVAVFNEDLQAQVLKEISKGTKVAIEGVMKSDRVYNGEKQYDMTASRIGLVNWFTRSGGGQAAKPKVETTEDEIGW